MYRQTKEVINIIVDAVEALGGRAEDIIRTRVFITDISLWEEAGRAHGEIFGHFDVPPVSAFVGISALLHPDLWVEVEATAIVGNQF